VNSNQFARWPQKQGIKIESMGKTGHKSLFNPKTGRWSQLPTHGGGKELGNGLIEKIKKQLGLK